MIGASQKYTVRLRKRKINRLVVNRHAKRAKFRNTTAFKDATILDLQACSSSGKASAKFVVISLPASNVNS